MSIWSHPPACPPNKAVWKIRRMWPPMRISRRASRIFAKDWCRRTILKPGTLLAWEIRLGLLKNRCRLDQRSPSASCHASKDRNLLRCAGKAHRSLFTLWRQSAREGFLRIKICEKMGFLWINTESRWWDFWRKSSISTLSCLRAWSPLARQKLSARNHLSRSSSSWSSRPKSTKTHANSLTRISALSTQACSASWNHSNSGPPSQSSNSSKSASTIPHSTSSCTGFKECPKSRCLSSPTTI